MTQWMHAKGFYLLEFLNNTYNLFPYQPFNVEKYWIK